MKKLLTMMITIALLLSAAGCRQEGNDTSDKSNNTEVISKDTKISDNTDLSVNNDPVKQDPAKQDPAKQDLAKQDPAKQDQQENNIITIGWEYYNYTDKENYDIPYTTVYLSVQGKEKKHYKVGSYVGELADVTKDNCSWELPENAIINCMGWFGGGGDILGVVKSGTNKLVVKHKVIEEALGDEELEKDKTASEFEDILTVDIQENAEIKITQGVKMDKDYTD